TITGQTPPRSLARLESDALEPPSHLGVAIPTHSERALMKALAVRPTERFQTMREFQEALTSSRATPAARVGFTYVLLKGAGQRLIIAAKRVLNSVKPRDQVSEP